jgi:predicted transglutaminase-like cysteine proteinase
MAMFWSFTSLKVFGAIVVNCPTVRVEPIVMQQFVLSQAVRAARRVVIAVLLCPFLAIGPGSHAQAPELFGFTAIPMPAKPDLSPYTKWTDMTRRLQQQVGWESENCATIFTPCPQRDWRKMLARAKSGSKEEQLDDVNRFVNRFDYVPDTVNWGGIDYWETPKEFFLKGGECKDFSISKYFSLRILGWPSDRLWMIVLQDMNLNVTHAVLAARLEGRTMILDNQVADLVDQGRIRHYRPIFGLSETGWVIYRPNGS